MNEWNERRLSSNTDSGIFERMWREALRFDESDALGRFEAQNE